MTASKIFFVFCLAFIIGIAVSSFLEIYNLTPPRRALAVGAGLVLAIILITVFWEHKKLVIIGFSVLFLILGIWRHQTAEIKIQKSELIKYNNLEKPISLIGTVIKEPDIRDKNIKLTISVDKIENNTNQNANHYENGSRSIMGRVLVNVGRYPEYQYGDKLKIKGKLESPKEFPDFDYKDYLAKEGIYSTINYPEIEKIAEKNGSLIYAGILKIKNKLREPIYQNLSPPQSSILGAIILGDKQKMSDELKDQLNKTGVRHITAISGMHISILTVILIAVFVGLGFWRTQAFYLTLAVLILFIIMIGSPASAVRAGIFGVVFLTAEKFGRQRNASRAIVLAAAIMLIFNPLLLKSDVGFQLSFLAIIGINYLAPVFLKFFITPPSKLWRKNFYYLYGIPHQFFSIIFLKNKTIKNIAAATLSAQVFTLPILIYNFGQFSLVAPIVNILIVPLLSFIMILGFLFLLAGLVLPALGWVFSFPVWLLLSYITATVNFFSQFSFSAVFLKISFVWLVMAYVVIAYITSRLYRKATLPDFIY